MSYGLEKENILIKIKQIAIRSGGKAPGADQFQAETGIKPHEWRGKIWRNWTDAVREAGFAPNKLQGALADEVLLDAVCDVAMTVQRFPTTGDLLFELPRLKSVPHPKTVLARWKMPELAARLADHADRRGIAQVAEFARAYQPRIIGPKDEGIADTRSVGFVYLQRYGQDYKIGFTMSLNKRGRQIQIELPGEIELVHSILTDDPKGVEAYWHKRFADRRTRGEWFRLTKSDVAAFRKWQKIA